MKARFPIVLAAMVMALLGAAAQVAGAGDDPATPSRARSSHTHPGPALALAVSFTSPL